MQNPKKKLKTYISQGMTVIDIGCGPGMFSLAMAEMVGPGGKVISVDLQDEMLSLVARKSDKSHLRSRILLHKNQPDSIGLSEKADFILACYMVHEVPDVNRFFKEVRNLLKTGGKFYVIEPSMHVSEQQFSEMIIQAKNDGLNPVHYPDILFSRAVVFQ